MPLLVLCGATGLVLDNEDYYRTQWKDAWITVFIFTTGFAALGLFPSTVEIFGFKFGVTASARIFWLLWGYAILVCEEFSCLEFHMNRDTISWILKKNTGGRYGEIGKTDS